MSKFGIRSICPEIANRIEGLWGTRLCEPYLEEVIAIYKSDPAGFNEVLYNELVGLLDLHRNLD